MNKKRGNGDNRKMKYPDKLDARAKYISELFKTVNMSVIDIIYSMNFDDPQLVEQLYFGMLDREFFMHEFMRFYNSLSVEEQIQLRRDMDKRDPYNYYRNMVIGWVLEEGIYKYLREIGILMIHNDNMTFYNGRYHNQRKKTLFERNHIARLDFKVGPLLFEVQDTLFPFKYNRGYYTIVTKGWKLKKLSRYNSYLININLPSKVVTVTHVFDYISSAKKVDNYYGPNKPGYKMKIPVDKKYVDRALLNNDYYCNKITACVSEFKNLPNILYHLYQTFVFMKMTGKLKNAQTKKVFNYKH